MNDECPKCREYADKGSMFCGACGRRLISNECPRCKEYTDNGSMFCGACGRQLVSNECPRCREYAANGCSFCGACGRPLNDLGPYVGPTQSYAPAPAKKQLGILESIFLVISMAIIAIAVFEAVTMLVNFPDVFSFLPNLSVGIFVIVPFPHVLFYWGEAGLKIYWVLVVIIILLCLITAIYKFVTKAREPGGITRPDAAENTAIFWVCIFLSANFFITLIVSIIVLSYGSDLSSPGFGIKLEQMFSMANAGVWEEIIARVMYIGVPMTIISLAIHRNKESLKCLLGGFEMSKTAVAFIIISGVIFGLAHYPGWGDQLWKVVTAGIMGMFLGYLFVRFGLYASILLHFVNDYLSSFDWMGIGWFSIYVSFLLMAIGAIAVIYILKRVWDFRGSLVPLPLFRGGCIKEK